MCHVHECTCHLWRMKAVPAMFLVLEPLGLLVGVQKGDVRVHYEHYIVIQEWWGLNNQIKRIVDRIAKDGSFIALAPDL